MLVAGACISGWGINGGISVRAQQATGDELGAVERALAREREQSEGLKRKTEDLAKETVRLRAELVASAEAVQHREQMIASLEAQVTELEREERDRVADLVAQRQQFSQVLIALERLARFPPEAMIAQPGKPVETVRSALLLRAVVPEIQRRAADLGRQVEELARARRQLAAGKASLQEETAGLEEEGRRLGTLLAQKKRLRQQTDSESKKSVQRVEELARQASSLRDLFVRLAEDKKKQELPARESVLGAVLPPLKPDFKALEKTASGTQVASLTMGGSGMWRGDSIEDLKGELPFPVVGDVISRYGEVNENGFPQRGVRVQTRPSAQVVATFEGTVAFVGDFRGYGQILIIEHAGGYHSLLAGMSRVDSAIGQEVLMGEPVGTMSTGSDETSILYVELRRDGQSINPLPWLASRSSGTQG